jgi:hypothetical protein
MSGKTIHMCLSVRGALNWNARELRSATTWCLKDDGSRYTSAELRNALMDELAQGHEVLPMSPDCDGFDFKTGCPGHPSRDSLPLDRETER